MVQNTTLEKFCNMGIGEKIDAAEGKVRYILF